MRLIAAVIVAFFPAFSAASLLDGPNLRACTDLSIRTSLLDETKAVLNRMIKGVPDVPAVDRERFRDEISKKPDAYNNLKANPLYRAFLVREPYDGMIRFMEQSKRDDPRETAVGAGMVLLLMPDLLEALEGFGGLDIDHIKGIRYSASMRLGQLIECSVVALTPSP